MNKRTFVFLDIENTLIEDFENPTFIAEKEMIAGFVEGASLIICFSWAVNNVDDLAKRISILDTIQRFYNFKFGDFILRDSLYITFKKKFGSGLDFNEFEDICRSLGKEYVFQLFIREKFAQQFRDGDIECYLYDDTVENTTLITHMNGSQITIKTVKV